jgi:hypothetical protein
MTFPPDRTMLSLAALDNASEGKSTPDGRQFARVRVSDDRLQMWEIDPAEIDRLEAEGWVELLPPADDDEPDAAKVQVTAKGEYALHRWVRKHHRRIPQLIRDTAFLLVETTK